MTKKIFIFTLIIVSVLYYLNQKDKLNVGDTGPSGGIVFYVSEGGLHGLEAAPTDQTNAPWGCYGTYIDGAGGTAIGTGAKNTADIVAGCIDPEVTTAAEVASDYTLIGLAGWFLPSLNELNLLYQNKHIVGGFDDDYYWSSSVYGSYSNNSWSLYFGKANHTKLGASRGVTLGVRAIRAF